MNCIYVYPISWSVRQQQNHSKTFHVVYHLCALIYVLYNIMVLMLLIVWITQSSFMVSIPSEISMQNGLSSKGSKWLTALFSLFKLKFSSRSSEIVDILSRIQRKSIQALMTSPHCSLAWISHILGELCGHQSSKQITLFSYCKLNGSSCIIFPS